MNAVTSDHPYRQAEIAPTWSEAELSSALFELANRAKYVEDWFRIACWVSSVIASMVVWACLLRPFAVVWTCLICTAFVRGLGKLAVRAREKKWIAEAAWQHGVPAALLSERFVRTQLPP